MKRIGLEELRKILDAESVVESSTEKTVKEIIEQVRQQGDKALVYFTRKFDGVNQKSIKVTKKDIDDAKNNLDAKTLQAARIAIKRVKRYHRCQMPSEFRMKEQGMSVEYRFVPVEKVGIYIPAGQAPLISTIIMTAVPAMVAGVKKIYVASPPSYGGNIHPGILGILGYLGIEDIFAMGGAHAIAAFAFGTQTVPQVDMVVGPGNKYVNTAKKILYGTVGIDLPAGPSEVTIFADSSANRDFIEADLLAQAEHRGSKVFFITSCEELGNEIGRKIPTGFWIYAKDRNQALEVINYIAPEHLQLFCKNPQDMIEKSIAGAIFVGNESPSALGDYFAGPSHVLPTGRTARFASGLSVYTFLRTYAVIKADRSFYKKNSRFIETLASIEGLSAHGLSLFLRRVSKNK